MFQKVIVELPSTVAIGQFIQAIEQQGFRIATFAATVGSCHPFIPKKEFDDYHKKIVDLKCSDNKIKSTLGPVVPWVF